MREIMRVVRSVKAYRYRELPKLEMTPEEAGFSIYRGVVVRWDEDYDARVLDFIDRLSLEDRKNLVAVQEHEESIAFRWEDHVPIELDEGKNILIDGDVWTVIESIVVEDVAE